MSIAAGPGQRLMLITHAPPARSLKQETDAASVLIWCRSRLQHGSLDRLPDNTAAFTGKSLLAIRLNDSCSAFTRHFSQLIQVAL